MTDAVERRYDQEAIQVISCAGQGGSVDAGSLSAEAAADLFGEAEGFKVDDPNVTFLEKKEVVADNDF